MNKSLIIAWTITLVIGVLLFGSVFAQELNPPETHVQIQSSGALSYGPYTYEPQVINEEETVLSTAKGDFRWLYYKSGDQACIYSKEGGTPRSGRDCYDGVTPDNKCSFFTWGFNMYGRTGSCTSLGIDRCQGLYCR